MRNCIDKIYNDKYNIFFKEIRDLDQGSIILKIARFIVLKMHFQ